MMLYVHTAGKWPWHVAVGYDGTAASAACGRLIITDHHYEACDPGGLCPDCATAAGLPSPCHCHQCKERA